MSFSRIGHITSSGRQDGVGEIRAAGSRLQPLLALLLAAATGCGGRVASVAPPADDEDSSPSVDDADSSPDSLGDSEDVADTPDVFDAAPSTPRSCESGRAGAGNDCGTGHSDDCCASLPVPGGSFFRGYMVETSPTEYPATLSDFWLDRYEITVGRFRAFVEAYPGSRPKSGDGAHASIPGSGWQNYWPIPATQADLRTQLAAGATSGSCGAGAASWTDQADANERRPMNCVPWQLLFAFCAWDRGQLPTDAQLDYAMAGGSEQRYFPWSSPPSSTSIDDTRAIYSADYQHPRLWPEEVGSRPSGAGRWGQLDLAGNVNDWSMDGDTPWPLVPCIDCGIVGSPGDHMSRTWRGGGFASSESGLTTDSAGGGWSVYLDPNTGARCARPSHP
jgi:formylglycine-generating enzyme required for sulfatase activity